MLLEKLLNENIKIDRALFLIQQNLKRSFEWYPVRGKKGCLFELGGTHFLGEFDLKIYVPIWNGETYEVLENGFSNTSFCLTSDGELSYSDKSISISNSSFGVNDFIKFIKKTDFRTYTPKIMKKYVQQDPIVVYSCKL